MIPRPFPHALALTLALSAAAASPAFAGAIAITGDGSWHPFTVDALLAPVSAPLGWIDDSGSPIDFAFVVGAGLTGTLTVVDAALSGDTYRVTNFGAVFADTSGVPMATFESARDVGLDYAAALADGSFSRGIYSLLPGSYRIGGSLLQSVTLDGVRLDSTAGAVRLSVSSVSPVPEPETYALLLAGLLTVGSLARRRSR